MGRFCQSRALSAVAGAAGKSNATITIKAETTALSTKELRPRPAFRIRENRGQKRAEIISVTLSETDSGQKAQADLPGNSATGRAKRNRLLKKSYHFRFIVREFFLFCGFSLTAPFAGLKNPVTEKSEKYVV